MVERWTISVPDDVAADVNKRFSHGDSRSEWVVDAIERKLAAESVEEENDTARARETERQPESDIVVPDDVPQRIDEADARAAIAAAVAFIEAEGGASQREIVREVMPEHPLGYDVPELETGKRFRGAWWRRVIKPGLEAHGDIQKPAPSETEWEFESI